MLLGIDVSKWQGVVDWKKAKSAGARFAFVRAGSITNIGGTCYKDYQFERNAKIAPEYMPIGFYWYFRPQHDPYKQADYFCSLIKDKPYRLPPVLDLENNGGLLPNEVTESAKHFVVQVYNRLKVWCLLYSRALWLNENTVKHEIWNLMDLWIARYKELTGPWSDGYCIPREWKERGWKFWQRTASGPGAEFGAKSRSIDLDYFNGDEKDFNLYIGASNAPHLVRVFIPLVANLRSGPEGPAIGATWRGATWPVIERTGNYYRVEAWIRADKVEEV